MDAAIAPTTAQQARDEFMTLLVAQLRNQDPLEPVQQQEFVQQLAQFSTLEGIEKLNDSMSGLVEAQNAQLSTQQMLQAADLVGQFVTYDKTTIAADGASRVTRETSIVDAVQLDKGNVLLQVDGELIELNQVRGFENGQTAPQRENRFS